MVTRIFGAGERQILRWVVLPMSLLSLVYCVWAWHPIVGVFALVSTIAAGVFGFDVNGANALSDNRLPHERWPEILDWRSGDEFRECDYHAETLVSLTDDGYAVLTRLGHKSYVPISKLVGHNASARTRRISEDLKRSNEYMELLDAFHQSVDELRKRDTANGVPK